MSRYSDIPGGGTSDPSLPPIDGATNGDVPMASESGAALARSPLYATTDQLRIYNAARTRFLSMFLDDNANQFTFGVNNSGQFIYFNTTSFNFQQKALVEYILRYTALTAAAGTMQAQESGRVYSNVGATGTITQPIGLPTSGSVFSFIRVADHPFRIYSANSEQIVVPGTIGGAGKYLELTQIGASVKFIRVSGYLIALNVSGTYSVEA